MPKFIKKRKLVVTSEENILEFSGEEVLEALRQFSDQVPSTTKNRFGLTLRVETHHADEYLDLDQCNLQVVWNEKLESVDEK